MIVTIKRYRVKGGNFIIKLRMRLGISKLIKEVKFENIDRVKKLTLYIYVYFSECFQTICKIRARLHSNCASLYFS